MARAKAGPATLRSEMRARSNSVRRHCYRATLSDRLAVMAKTSAGPRSHGVPTSPPRAIQVVKWSAVSTDGT